MTMIMEGSKSDVVTCGDGFDGGCSKRGCCLIRSFRRHKVAVPRSRSSCTHLVVHLYGKPLAMIIAHASWRLVSRYLAVVDDKGWWRRRQM